jgi:hypothetical protein
VLVIGRRLAYRSLSNFKCDVKRTFKHGHLQMLDSKRLQLLALSFAS